jgi:uncharacterized protein (UPF0128 family)
MKKNLKKVKKRLDLHRFLFVYLGEMRNETNKKRSQI